MAQPAEQSAMSYKNGAPGQQHRASQAKPFLAHQHNNEIQRFFSKLLEVFPMTDIRTYRYSSGASGKRPPTSRCLTTSSHTAGRSTPRSLRVDARTRCAQWRLLWQRFLLGPQRLPAERVKLPFKAAEIVKHHRAEIAEILALETSSTISFATFQQDLVAATIEQAAGWAYLPKEDVLSNSRGQTALLIWSLISAVPSRREQGTRPPPRTWSQWR